MSAATGLRTSGRLDYSERHWETRDAILLGDSGMDRIVRAKYSPEEWQSPLLEWRL